MKEDTFLEIIDLTVQDSSCRLPALYVSAVPRKKTSSIKRNNLIQDGCNWNPIACSEFVGNNGKAPVDTFSSIAWLMHKTPLVDVVIWLEDDQ